MKSKGLFNAIKALLGVEKQAGITPTQVDFKALSKELLEILKEKEYLQDGNQPLSRSVIEKSFGLVWDAAIIKAVEIVINNMSDRVYSLDPVVIVCNDIADDLEKELKGV